MPITEDAIKIYKWIAEQEAKGQKLSVFVEWAKDQERARFIRMYRKDPSEIKVDWMQAFGGNSRARLIEPL
jgi:hypothetical protein